MILKTIENDTFLQRRIKTIPISRNLKESFINLFNKWVDMSGDDWAIDRVKALKDCILNSFARNGQMSHKPEWFAATKSGMLKGVPGSLWRLAMSSEKNLTAVLNLLQVYTVIRHRQSDVDIRKIGRSIMTTDGAERILLNGEIRKALQEISLYKRVHVEPPIPLMQVLPGKASHAEMVPWDINYIFKGYFGTAYREYLERCVGGEVDIFYDSKYDVSLDGVGFPAHIHYVDTPDMSNSVGYIHITTGPGGKDRYFASPNQVIQRGLEPLKNALGHVLKNVPWDCTFNQRKADHIILKRLKEGPVYSVDLSKATDNFPWYFQKEVLRQVLSFKGKQGDDTYVSFRLLSDCIEKGVWTMEADCEIFAGVRWTKGQPLGMAPSFFTFTLSHGLLLFILNGYQHSNDFFVLGDDVIIFKEELHRAYREVLEKWEIPISEAKSFQSDRLAQFAGVTYTRNTSRWIPKWNPVTKQNILDIAAWWYPGFTKGLKDEDLIDRVLALPEPYGIGRNPKGLPLDERFPDSLVAEMLLDEEKAMPSNTFVSANRLAVLQEVDCDFIWEIIGSIRTSDKYTSFNSNRIDYFGNTLVHHMDGTEAPGYPSERFRRVDPYSLGPIRHWKNVFDKTSAM